MSMGWILLKNLQMINQFQYVEQLKQGFSPLLLSFLNIKISSYLFFLKFSHNFFIPKRTKARVVRFDLNRFCPCFWKCYLGSAISKCYRKISILILLTSCQRKQRKSTENKSFSVLFMVTEAGLDLIKVATSSITGGSNMPPACCDFICSTQLHNHKKTATFR